MSKFNHEQNQKEDDINQLEKKEDGIEKQENKEDGEVEQLEKKEIKDDDSDNEKYWRDQVEEEYVFHDYNEIEELNDQLNDPQSQLPPNQKICFVLTTDMLISKKISKEQMKREVQKKVKELKVYKNWENVQLEQNGQFYMKVHIFKKKDKRDKLAKKFKKMKI